MLAPILSGLAIGCSVGVLLAAREIRSAARQSLRRELLWVEFAQSVAMIVGAAPANLRESLLHQMDETNEAMTRELQRQDALGRWGMPPPPGEPWKDSPRRTPLGGRVERKGSKGREPLR